MWIREEGVVEMSGRSQLENRNIKPRKRYRVPLLQEPENRRWRK